MLSTLMKKSKMNDYNHYFMTNWNNIKNTWKGLNTILNINNTHSNIPKSLVPNDTTIAEPIKIANIFNNFFISIAAKTKASIKYSHKHFCNFLKKRSDNSFFLIPTDKYETINILKIAKVVPIHKKHSKLVYFNYRPISLLSNLENILDELMYSRIFKFLNDNYSIYPLRFRFRQKYSRKHALISLTEDIAKNFDEENIGCVIFVDL